MGILTVSNPYEDAAIDPDSNGILPSGSSIGTAFADNWFHTPVYSLIRHDQMAAAAADQGPIIAGGRGGVLRAPNPNPSPMLDPDQANAQYGVEGELHFDKPVRQSQAELMNGWKIDELKRRDQLNRSDSDLASEVGRFGAGALAGVLDPLNIAASMVPILGEERFASIAAQSGSKTFARVIEGGAAGAAATAAVEPAILLQANNEQSDYHLADSLKNIAFGTLFGSGLHAGFGAISDFISRAPIETRQTALTGSIAAVADGRQVAVADLFSMNLRDALSGGTSLGTAGVTGGRDLENAMFGRAMADDFAASQRAAKGLPPIGGAADASNAASEAISGASVTIPGEASLKNGELRTFQDEGAAQVAASKQGAKGNPKSIIPTDDGKFALAESVNVERLADHGTERAAQRFIDGLPEQQREGLQILPHQTAQGQRYAVVRGLTSDQARAARQVSGAVSFPDRPAVADVPRQPPEIDPQVQIASAVRDMLGEQRRTQLQIHPADLPAINTVAEKSIGYDKPQNIETQAAEAAELIQATDDRVAELKKAGAFSDAEINELQAGDEIVSKAQSRGRGIMEAAACLLRAL